MRQLKCWQIEEDYVRMYYMMMSLPDAEQGLEEHHVPPSSKAVQCKVENHNGGRISQGAEEEVEEYVPGELCGIEGKTAKIRASLCDSKY